MPTSASRRFRCRTPMKAWPCRWWRRKGATPEEVDKVISVIEEMGYQAQPMPGTQRTAVGLIGNDGRVDASRLEGLPGVHEIIHVSQPYKQVSREWKAEPTVVRLPGGV